MLCLRWIHCGSAKTQACLPCLQQLQTFNTMQGIWQQKDRHLPLMSSWKGLSLWGRGLGTVLSFPYKLTLVSRGSTLALFVGENVTKYPNRFEREVRMWVFEEQVGTRNLSDIINSEHCNVKYLPSRKLPDNVVAVPNLEMSADKATLLIFVLPAPVEREYLQHFGSSSFSPKNQIHFIFTANPISLFLNKNILFSNNNSLWQTVSSGDNAEDSKQHRRKLSRCAGCLGVVCSLSLSLFHGSIRGWTL